MKTVSTGEAARVLRDGGVILSPTETVVGLIAAEHGLQRLSEIKHRDPEKPIALLCASRGEAFEMASEVPAIAETLAERYWPGPLTLVLPKTEGGTIGVRVPDHEVIEGLLAAAGQPLYATSANLSDEPPASKIDGVDPRVARSVDAVLEGEAGDGEASAVVDLSGGEVRLLRSNEKLTKDELARLVQDGETKNV